MRIVAVLALLFAGCAHTPEEIRLHCLRVAHEVVKVPESDSANRQPMVREVYLRCLAVKGVEDAPLPK